MARGETLSRGETLACYTGSKDTAHKKASLLYAGSVNHIPMITQVSMYGIFILFYYYSNVSGDP